MGATDGTPEIGEGMRDAGVEALAFGPIGPPSDTVALIVVGTCDRRYAGVVASMMPALVAFGVAANTVLIERLEARRREDRLRGSMDLVLPTQAYRPVFQLIVELRSGDTIGYEALTRFDSGIRPDACTSTSPPDC